MGSRPRRLAAARRLSLDVRLGPPGLGSLHVRFAFAIHGCARSHSPLEGTGSPEPPELNFIGGARSRRERVDQVA